MTDPMAERPVSDEQSHQRDAAGVFLPVVLGLVVSAGLLMLYAGWEFAFGHLRYVTEHSWLSPEMRGPRISLTVIALTGFAVGSRAYGRPAMIRDLSDLAPQLSCSPTERAALLLEAESLGRSAKSWIGSLMAVPVGLLVVTSQSPGVPYLLSNEPWNHDVVWALVANVVLFSILGRITAELFRTNEFFAKVERRLAPVNLLRPQVLAPFARRGLRNAFFWIGGSSLASIVFVAQSFSWLTGLVLLGTLLMGTLAFLLPVRGLHGRIRAAKEAELERLHEAIQRTREDLLHDAGDAAASNRMPGLLAYEHRIAAVREWPIDPPQIARFLLMVGLGLGSWLGGAVVGHLVDAFWR